MESDDFLHAGMYNKEYPPCQDHNPPLVDVAGYNQMWPFLKVIADRHNQLMNLQECLKNNPLHYFYNPPKV